MAVLHFTLSEEGVGVFHDVLVCISKFSDDVILDARKDKLTLTALNLSRSAYACFTFATNRFFSQYSFEGNAQYRERFSCQLYVRSLVQVFRTRLGGDSSRDRDRETTIDRCEVSVDDGPGKKSRLNIRIFCRNGIGAVHALPFEPKAPVHAKFDKNEVTNHWAISPRTLRQLMEYFGPRIELLDINTEGDRVVNFACFTDKVIDLKSEEVLKKPLHTTVAVDREEFGNIKIEDKHHIIISVRDFRAVLNHAHLTTNDISVLYSNPGRPLKINYRGDGLLCDFILMTVGDKSPNASKTKKARASAARPAVAPAALESASHRASSVATTENPLTPRESQRPPLHQRKPVGLRTSQFDMRPPPVPPQTTPRSDVVVVGELDDDQRWEPMDPDGNDEEEEEPQNSRLGWDTSDQRKPPTLSISSLVKHQAETKDDQPDRLLSGLEPTQRLSEVRRFGLFSS